MPRYFFSTIDGEPFKDHCGEELPDDGSARREAVRLMAGLLKDDPDEFLESGRLVVVVTEAEAGTLFTMESSVASAET